jgi:hypothetical protein
MDRLQDGNARITPHQMISPRGVGEPHLRVQQQRRRRRRRRLLRARATTSPRPAPLRSSAGARTHAERRGHASQTHASRWWCAGRGKPGRPQRSEGKGARRIATSSDTAISSSSSARGAAVGRWGPAPNQPRSLRTTQCDRHSGLTEIYLRFEVPRRHRHEGSHARRQAGRQGIYR